MLLPSDIARLVLGYLQQERLTATCRAFISESPDLKEYAEHSTEDGAIPACVFSLFGKNLNTILNEYVAIKAKECSQESQVPAMMTSLWRKLDFTLNQIRCMQNSPSIYNNQRFRTRNGILNVRHQRAQPSPPAPGSSGLLSVTPSPGQHSPSPSPVCVPQAMLGCSTPICYSSLHARPSPLCVSQSQVQERSRAVLNVSRDSPLQVVVPDRRFSPGQLSPGRRKCDSPRRRGGLLAGQGGAPRTPQISTVIVETEEFQNEGEQEPVSESFPQMVIENARDKILSDKSLQEKLAENINKFLGSENNPQTSKQGASGAMVQDPSIDEILGLQAEIHMTDEAIRDILEQTESDPAFQALFDLFDYGKNRSSEPGVQGGAGPISVDQSAAPAEAQESEPSESPSEPGDQGAGCKDSVSVMVPTPRTPKTKSDSGPRSKKSRKTAHPLPCVSRVLLASSSPHGNGELLLAARPTACGVGQPENRATASRHKQTSASHHCGAAVEACRGKDSNSSLLTADKDGASSSLAEEEGMDIDLQLETDASPEHVSQPSPLQPPDQEHLQKGSTDPSPVQINAPLPSCDRVQSEMRRQEATGTQNSPPEPLRSSQDHGLADKQMTVSPSEGPFAGAVQTDGGEPSNTAPEPWPCGASLQAKGQPEEPGPGASPALGELAGSACSASVTGKDGQAKGESHSWDSKGPSPAPCRDSPWEPVAVAPGPTLQPPVGNPPCQEHGASKFVSLKIIISDDQEERPRDSASGGSVSSTSSDRVPTIVLSSPAKAPVPAGSLVTTEETVQAVSCLQRAEQPSPGSARPRDPAGTPAAGPEEGVQLSLASVPEVQAEAGFLQLVPASSSYGGSSSYFLVTDQAAAGQAGGQPQVMVLPGAAGVGPVSSTPHILATPPRSRPVISSSGSALFISSPVQPVLQSMVVPVSVVGQSTSGSFSVAHSQMPLSVRPAVNCAFKVKLKPKLAPKASTDIGKSGPPVSDQGTDATGLQKQNPVPLQPRLKSAGPSQHAAPTEAPSSSPPPASGSNPMIGQSHRRVLCFDLTAPERCLGTTPAPVQTRGSGDTSASMEAPVVVTPTVFTAASSSAEQPKTKGPSCKPCDSVQPQAVGTGAAAVSRDGDAPRPDATTCSDRGNTSAPRKELERSRPPSSTDSSKRAPLQTESEHRQNPHGSSGDEAAAKQESSGRSLDSRNKSQTSDNKEEQGGTESKRDSAHSGKAAAADPRLKSNVSGTRKEADQSARGREGLAETRGSSQDTAHVAAGKENKLEGRNQERQPAAALPPGEPAGAHASQLNSIRHPNKTSPLTKQAAEMLQDIQGHIPTATPSKSPELPLPRTPGSGRHPEEPLDCLRTPVRPRQGRDGDGTPRHLPPPATPDLPTCSPASEAGSENSINMAAHTLMILSRAAIARKGTPLKDSVQQQQGTAGAGAKDRKRKHPKVCSSPPGQKDQQCSLSSSSKKKAKKQKKLLDSFPDDLDVDKFLSSLHYDE
ncbi:protein NPAT [Lepisosteus oculatus]|uniref:protein NPAT n=1 Tax=Lepisosteus oculatus TaxID=7918 RepID=UPI0037159B79